jgi:hypothetical protein
VDVLCYAIEELGHSQAELAGILGSRSRASEVLARRRPLTLEMIQKINASWKIPADLLVQPLSDRRKTSLSEADDFFGRLGHAGATANLKLTFHLDHSAGANQPA